jgi:signal peptidase II
MSPRLAGGVIALLVVLVDQLVKIAVLSHSDGLAVDSTRLTPFLDLTLRWNRGISFSLFAGDSQSGQTGLLALTFVAIALLAWWLIRSRSGLPAVALGLIIGGALGNAIDRIAHGAVVDYLDLHAFGRHFFVFNVADAAINIGVVLLIFDLLAASRAPNSRNQGSPPQGASLD